MFGDYPQVMTALLKGYGCEYVGQGFNFKTFSEVKIKEM
jgi:hypothetical protein